MQINRISNASFNQNFGAKLHLKPNIMNISADDAKWVEDSFSKETSDIDGEVVVSKGLGGFGIVFNNNNRSQYLHTDSPNMFSNDKNVVLQTLVKAAKPFSMMDAIYQQFEEYRYKRFKTTIEAKDLMRDAFHQVRFWADPNGIGM